MRLVFIGNCQAKALSEYFIRANVSVFESIYYKYILDDLKTWNIDEINNADIFIYQDANLDTLVCASNDINKQNYVPNVIAQRLRVNGKLCISFPSIYFSAYFPEPLSSFQARQHFVDDVPKEFFPNWTLTYDLIQTICSNQSVENKMESILDRAFIDFDTLKAGWEKTYTNLKSRELANQVDIPMADWMFNNWKKKRLMHITNHPTRITLQYLMNRILDVFDEHFKTYPLPLRWSNPAGHQSYHVFYNTVMKILMMMMNHLLGSMV